MGAVFAVVCAIAFVWSGIKFQVAYHALQDAIPPQFQGGEMSRYAFPVYALHPSTPLALQADYVKSLAGGTIALLCFSASCFLFGRSDGGLLALLGFGAGTVSTFKSWNTYKANCSRVTTPHGEAET